MDRGSQLDEDHEDDEEDKEDEEEEDEAGGGRQEAATDIKSNNPHLAGGEKHGRMGISQGIAHGSNQMLWLKMAQGSAVRVSRFYHLSWFHLHELTPQLGAL